MVAAEAMTAMTKARADYYLRRCYRLLEDPDTIVHLRKLPQNIHGMAMGCADVMVVDPRRDVLSTIVHECFHIMFPAWSETKVLKHESGVVNKMTKRQWRNLIERVARKV